MSTPLNGVLGMARMLLQPAIPEDERQGCVRTICNSGKMPLTIDVTAFTPQFAFMVPGTAARPMRVRACVRGRERNS